MMENFDPKLYKNLINLVKMFEGRPYHLIKFLMSQSAFNDSFLRDVMESGFFEKLDQEDSSTNLPKVYFIDISQMNDFFDSMLSGQEWTQERTPNLTQELNSKLDRYIREERYEDAIRIRDYMNKLGINRISPDDF